MKTYPDWQAIIAKAKKAGGDYVLAISDTPASKLYSVRERRHPDLHQPDGYLQAEMRNRAKDPDTGQVRGDLYVAWARARTTERTR
jgi:hypothetical protein